jgi:hypothetical protein
MEETEVKGQSEKLSAYEVVLTTSDQKDVEVRLSPSGRILEDTGAKKPEKRSDRRRTGRNVRDRWADRRTTLGRKLEGAALGLQPKKLRMKSTRRRRKLLT